MQSHQCVESRRLYFSIHNSIKKGKIIINYNTILYNSDCKHLLSVCSLSRTSSSSSSSVSHMDSKLSTLSPLKYEQLLLNNLRLCKMGNYNIYPLCLTVLVRNISISKKGQRDTKGGPCFPLAFFFSSRTKWSLRSIHFLEHWFLLQPIITKHQS